MANPKRIRISPGGRRGIRGRDRCNLKDLHERLSPAQGGTRQERARQFEAPTDNDHRSEDLTPDTDIVDRNSDKLGKFFRAPRDVRFKRVNKIYEAAESKDAAKLVKKQDVCGTDMFVHTSGLILDIGSANSVDQHIVYDPYTVRLEMEVLVDHPDPAKDEPGQRRVYFAIRGPENLETGQNLPLIEVLEPQAIYNLEVSLHNLRTPAV